MTTAVVVPASKNLRPTVRAAVAAVLTVVLAATLLQDASAAASAAGGWKPPTPHDVAGVAVTPVKHTVRPAWTASGREARPTAAVWPEAGSVTVDLTGDAARTADGDRQVGALPVRVRASTTPGAAARDAAGRDAVPVSRVTVNLADRATAQRAGVSGLVATIGRADGRRQSGAVDVTFDYSGFAHAYGGDWASRLRVIRLTDGKPLAGRNNPQSQTVSANVPLEAAGATTIALAAAPSGDNGDYTATSLKPASTWQVSTQTGSFSWSYPLTRPPAMGGPEPDLAMAYSSGAVDGLSAGTNTQGSWIGDGWDMWPGFIERQYKACADDKDAIRGGTANNNSVYSGDQCWYKPEGNATISFNGQATELVKSTGNTWKATADDGSRIELLKDTGLGNGDDDGEYWKVTTPDGTQYFFGRNHGQGGSSAATATNSTWTMPVYGNHPDEPGYSSTGFAASRTTQAWRWNLDLVIDPRGNTMTYFYAKEQGAYGREGDKDKRTTYDRGGYLTRIEYGSRTDAPATALPTAQILFDTEDRCAAACWSGTTPIQASWLDTPWDQYCTAAPCTEQLAPTFWTAKRLFRIRAQVYTGSGTSYQDVTWWTLRHTYLQSGASEGQPMWLAGITRTGKVTTAGGTEVSDPEIVFDPGSEALANRVDAMADGRSNLFRYRITTITTETGAQISVTYSPTECTRSALPAVHANTKRCYPQYYGPDGEEPTLDWFHKYRVDRVDTYDNAGGFSHEQTNYDYLDSPAWHYDDSELVDEDKRTWGEFRGYGKVRVRAGLESGVQSATEYLYFRGMDDDKQPTGTRDEWITDSQDVKVEDHDAYAGMIRETTTLLGAGGTWVSGSITTPARQGPTATSGPLKAWMRSTNTVRSRTKLSNGSTRWTKTVTTVNGDNLPTQIDDLGDESTATDDTCTRTWYARNGATWMLGLPKKTETAGVNCSTTPALPGDMLSSTRTTYDADTNNWDTYLPVKGTVAKVEQIDSWNGTTPSWVTISRSKHDAIGRVTESTDALDRTFTTAYTPAAGGPVTAITTTNPLKQATTTTYATAWQLPTAVVDANNIRTDLTYDGLGRLTKVWEPGRPKSTYPSGPSVEYSYLVRNNAPTAVITKTLMPYGTSTYATSITLYDGLLRTRQIQTQAPGGGRTLTDTVYDSRGLLEWSTSPYYDKTNTPPNTTLYAGPGTPAVPALTQNIYDGAGRLTDAIFKVGVNETTNEKWRTTTIYDGEKTSTIPPAGGTATTTITDARGQTVSLRQYKNRANVGSDDPATFDMSRYEYTDRGELAALTDPAGNTWRYTYDQRGHKIRDDDPDRGTTTYTYDNVGQLVTSTDAEQKTLAYTYDDLGRKTSLHDGSTTGPLRAEWTYDTLPNGIGKPVASKRYEPAGSANAYVNEIAAYDTYGRPTTTKVSIPATEGSLCAAGTLTPCTYSYATTYRANGDVATFEQPAAAGLAKEKLTYVYNEVGLLDGLFSSSQIYLYDVLYNKLGQLNQQILGEFGKRTWITHTIDENTGRVTNTNSIPELKPEIFNFTYEHDDSGNIIKIADAPAGGATDTQCYDYDYLRRLTNAWTPTTGDCAPSQRAADKLGGPAPYWHSYSYQPGTDNRYQETVHTSTPTTRTYSYPSQGGGTGSHPHAVNTITSSGPTPKTETFTYEKTGNTKTRSGPNGTQTLTWTPEGKLRTATDTTGVTSHIYDADGNRLIRRDPNGAATLYLPGGTEVRKPATGNATGARYYTGADGTIALRTSSGSLDWNVNDHHGTAEATVTNATLTTSRRRSYPFGQQRGTTTGVWAPGMDKGFVGGTQDPNGLTHLGTREYDPATGRFMSVDPLMDLTDPRHWNGYSYANNNPVTLSDPSGLDPGGGQRIDEERKQRQSAAAGGGNAASSGGGSTSGGSSAVGDNNVTKARQAAKEAFLATYTEDNINCKAHPGDCYTFRKAVVEDDYDPVQAEIQVLCGGMRLDFTNCLNDYGFRWNCGVAACPESMIHAGEIVVEFAMAGGFGMAGRALVTATAAETTARAGAVRAAAHACSFQGDTLVLMADGTTKPIMDVKAGDKVLATDPETGEEGTREVTHLWVHDDQLVNLELADGDTLTTTEDHPFWNSTDHQWQQAQQLDPGDRLLTSTGDGPRIRGINWHTIQHGKAYNLTIEDIHTYYVLAGNTPVLVHNTCVNWSPKSRPTFGHTFSQHGAGAKNTKSLMDRARSTGQEQGQWLDNDAASDFLRGAHLPDAGPRGVVLPEGLGQVIMPDGSIVPATRAILVPSSNGLYKTAYPVLGP
ncbi:polymorphic toxin-type HINT domain-containing protein [Micromonospora costi]|uniref:polymorphic toxin-type HINT domain-containing protein n=1 Tax=Micromonospora costi TaxID=1530042 RepID=UPI0033F0F00B